MLSATFGVRGRTISTIFKLWDVGTGKTLREVDPDKMITVAAALSPDTKTIAWADQDATAGGNIHLLDTTTGKETYCLAASGIAYTVSPRKDEKAMRFPGVGTKFVFAQDGRILVTRALGGQLVEWDVATGKELRRLGQPLPPPTWLGGTGFLAHPGLALSPDGKTLAMAGAGNAVTLLDLATGRELYPWESHHAAISVVRYSADGSTLTSLAGDGTARTWQATTAEEIKVTRVPPGMLTSTLSPNGRILASAALDGRVQLTDARTGKELGVLQTSLRGPLRMALSPDGQALAAGISDSPTIQVFDITTGKKTLILEPRQKDTLPADGKMYIPFRSAPVPVFSPDGNASPLPDARYSVSGTWPMAAKYAKYSSKSAFV